MRKMEIDAVIFDLHHTITMHRGSVDDLFRKVATDNGIDISGFSDEELGVAIRKAEEWQRKFQIDNNVDVHWGAKPEHWLTANRMVFEELGIENLTDETINEFERRWKYEAKDSDFEILTEEGKETLRTLHERGIKIGIATRRYDSPIDFLKGNGVLEYISSVQWTGVYGFSKPNPYTLIMAAIEMDVNPQRCAFAGNYVSVDVEAAQRAGMLPILLVWANPWESEKATEDVAVLESPIEILNFFKS